MKRLALKISRTNITNNFSDLNLFSSRSGFQSFILSFIPILLLLLGLLLGLFISLGFGFVITSRWPIPLCSAFKFQVSIFSICIMTSICIPHPFSLHPPITTSAAQTRSHPRLMEPGNPVFRWDDRPHKLPRIYLIIWYLVRSSFRIISVSYNPLQIPNSGLFQRSQRLLQAIFPPPTPSVYFRRQGMLTVTLQPIQTA